MIRGRGPRHDIPVNSDVRQYQMVYMTGRGLRCIAYDRRGYGRSGKPWRGYDYDTLADDLALELPGLLLVIFVLSVDEALLMLAEDAPPVGQLFEQPLDVVEGGLRPLVVKLLELLASQHRRPPSGSGKLALGAR